MSYFIPLEKRVYVSTVQFTNLSPQAINQFECSQGERAGFRLQTFTDYESGKEIVISHIYDCSNGDVVYLTSINIQPETDLVGGLFSSGVFPSGNVFDQYTKFRKCNYV